MTVDVGISVGGAYPMGRYPAIGRLAERVGVDELHVGDDLILRPAWPILGLLAEHTSRVRLGPGITSPTIVHPAAIAANVAALDELSGGRAVCGLGRGGFNTLIGVAPADPVAMLREAVEVIERTLAREATPYAGEYFQADRGLVLDFVPPRPRVPMFVGTWGPRMASAAGSLGLGLKVNGIVDPARFAALVDRARDAARAAGHDPDALPIIASPISTIAPDRATAVSISKRKIAMFYPYLAPLPEQVGIGLDEVAGANAAYLAGDVERAESLVSDLAVESFTLTGTCADAVAKAAALAAAGATQINLGFTGDTGPVFGGGPSFEEWIELLGSELIPALKAWPAGRSRP